MPRRGTASSKPSAAVAYGEMRCLSLEHGVASKKLPVAQQALVQAGLAESEAPSREHDQQLLQACEQPGDAGAFLCLRCRVSWPLEQRVRSLHSQNARNYGVELIELMAFALDDTGRVLPFQPEPERQDRKQPPQPFGVEVIRSYRPELSGLPHWAQQKLMGHGPMREYLRQHGMSLQRDWSLLGDTSQRRVVEAVSLFEGAITPESARALHARYWKLYRQAKLAYLQKTGRQQGWQPDESFLLAVDPDQPPRQTKELLERIAKAVRFLESGRWLKQESVLFDGDALERLADAAAAEAWSESDEGDGLQEGEVKKLMEDVGLRYVAAMLGALEPEGLERRIWQAWSQGLRQRQIAELCGTNGARVSRTVQEERRAGEIATQALERLQRALPQQPSAQWAGLFRSVERLKQAERGLMNHLLKPEQEGDISPLRRWVQHTLQPPCAPVEGECGSGEGR
ncbi:MAG: hypothetical protein VKI83_08955 [Synechococcaceae cyanobacterium]|nr:hypothetical protein [Synechococcaceae cyanobacterium]